MDQLIVIQPSRRNWSDASLDPQYWWIDTGRGATALGSTGGHPGEEHARHVQGGGITVGSTASTSTLKRIRATRR